MEITLVETQFAYLVPRYPLNSITSLNSSHFCTGQDSIVIIYYFKPLRYFYLTINLLFIYWTILAYSPFTIHHSSLTIHHSPLTTLIIILSRPFNKILQAVNNFIKIVLILVFIRKFWIAVEQRPLFNAKQRTQCQPTNPTQYTALDNSIVLSNARNNASKISDVKQR